MSPVQIITLTVPGSTVTAALLEGHALTVALIIANIMLTIHLQRIINKINISLSNNLHSTFLQEELTVVLNKRAAPKRNTEYRLSEEVSTFLFVLCV